MILPDLVLFGGEEASAASFCSLVSFRFLFSFLPVRHKLVKILDKRVLLKIVKYRVLWMWLKYGVRSCLHQFHKRSRSFISRTKTLLNICLNKRKSTHTIPFQLNTLTFSAINNFMMDATELKLGGYGLLIINTGTRERDDYSRIPIGKQGIRCVFQRKENHWFINFEETFRQHTFYQAEQHRLTFFCIFKVSNEQNWTTNILDVYSTNSVQIGVWTAKNTHKQEMLRKSSATNWKCYANPA